MTIVDLKGQRLNEKGEVIDDESSETDTEEMEPKMPDNVAVETLSPWFSGFNFNR